MSAPAPARRRRSYPRIARVARARVRRTVSRANAAYSSASVRTRMGGIALGGFGVGLIEKYLPNLPTLPVVGRKGAIALAVYAMQPKSKILQDIGLAAAAMAGYQFGMEGRVTGYDDSDVFATT